MPRLTSDGGNLLSTAIDYQRFAQMLANDGQLEGVRILGRKPIQFTYALNQQGVGSDAQPGSQRALATPEQAAEGLHQ
jgi:CubicO group peptidase (beta-lactamase class C family)